MARASHSPLHLDADLVEGLSLDTVLLCSDSEVQEMINRTVDVQPISDGSGTCGYIAKGHVTNPELELAIRQSGWSGADEFEIVGRHVDQTIMRCIPAPHTDEYAFTYEYSEPGRGAFKCTVVYL
jgi:hypothetical protein